MIETLYPWQWHDAVGVLYYTTLDYSMTEKPEMPDHTVSSAVLKGFIDNAVYAPSGDNSQPWRFRIEDSAIVLLNIPNADATLYNFKQRGSRFAHGAIIENLSILARAQGYRTEVSLFPDIPDATARISFIQDSPKAEPLVGAIKNRATNRKPYRKIPLEASHRTMILDSVNDRSGVELRLAEGQDHLSLLARTVSTNERLLMENRTLHDFLFGMIRWSLEEERATPGLYLKTMELPPPVQVLFRFVLRHWAAVKALNFIGLSRFIPLQSAQGYRASSAFGAIVLTGDTDSDFVRAGRAFQRAWLTATSAGMSIQPVTAIPYLAQRVEAGAAEAFSPEHQEMIRRANSVISDVFHLQDREYIAMLFRIGYGDKPSAASSKALPVILES